MSLLSCRWCFLMLTQRAGYHINFLFQVYINFIFKLHYTSWVGGPQPSCDYSGNSLAVQSPHSPCFFVVSTILVIAQLHYIEIAVDEHCIFDHISGALAYCSATVIILLMLANSNPLLCSVFCMPVATEHISNFVFSRSKNIFTQCKWLVRQHSCRSIRRFWHSS